MEKPSRFSVFLSQVFSLLGPLGGGSRNGLIHWKIFPFPLVYNILAAQGAPSGQRHRLSRELNGGFTSFPFVPLKGFARFLSGHSLSHVVASN